ncbi:MAG: Gfo/Idh/MocA family oxidoreductase [Chloroflexi bacterium]|nr:Gfo/Idh/MocA family oxidoreductase [Chloroflexota bacterium]
MAKIRFGIIGVGSRGIRTFGRHLRGAYADRAELIALADVDPHRLGVAAKMLEVDKTYASHSQLIDDAGVDAVVITTPDYTHAAIALEAMDAGKDVICEKPVATTIDDANRLLEAGRRFGKSFQVGFVLRYAPFFKGMHDAIVEGRIGRPLFATAVDNRAGSGYFRSWHRLRQYSGGLLNHKSGHTLDILNWMLDGIPTAVSATGGVAHYGPRDWAGDYCSSCAAAGVCSEYIDFTQGLMGELFHGAEIRGDSKTDVCVYNSDKDTVDHASLNVEYQDGQRASYGLCLFAPYNQRELGVTGTEGKVEGREGEDRVRLTRRAPDRVRFAGGYRGQPGSEEYLAVDQPGGEGVAGGHGGGDVGLLDDCFAAFEGQRDPVADLEAGYWSAVLGIAAEESVARGGQRLTLAEMGVAGLQTAV